MPPTKQEVLNKVWDWFVVQGKPRSASESSCFYRQPETDCRCAIGVLIPDELYDPVIEAKEVKWILDVSLGIWRQDHDQKQEI